MEKQNVSETLDGIFSNIPEELELTDQDKETIKDYFLTPLNDFSEEKKDLLRSVNERRLNFEKEKFDYLYDKDSILEITTLISFVSYAALPNADQIELTPIDKTLKLFPGINRLVLLCSRETARYAEELNNQKSAEYYIIIKKVEIDRFEDSYNVLRKAIENEEIIEKESVIDLTLGLKMTSLSFYKISTEFGVKTVNWQEIQAENISGRSTRVPGTNNFYLVEEPKLENYKLFRNIDNAISSFDFKSASLLYDQINNEELRLVYSELDKVFNFTVVGNFSNFRKRISNFFNIIKNEKIRESTLVRFKPLFILLENIQSEKNNRRSHYNDYDFSSIFEVSNLKKYNPSIGIKNTVWLDELNMDLLTEDERIILYHFFYIKKMEKRSNGDSFIYKSIIEKMFQDLDDDPSDDLDCEIDVEKIVERIKDAENIQNVTDEALNIVNDLMDLNETQNIDYGFIKDTDFISDLKELKKRILLTQEKLYIPNLDIEIDLLEAKDIAKCLGGSSAGKRIILDLFKSDTGEIKNFYKLLPREKEESDFDNLSADMLTKKIKTPWTRFHRDVDEVNQIFTNYLKGRGIHNVKNILILNDEKRGDLNKYRNARLSLCPDYFFERTAKP